MKHEFICFQCGLNKIHESDFSTGYGTDKSGHKICFDCCGLNDAKVLENLKPKEKFCLYWNGKQVTNWPVTLAINPHYVTKGKHNLARTRETVYFTFAGRKFMGIQYGEYTQVLHIKLVK